ncbi:MAG: hypothetical protein H0T92_09455 [Pyrinomonadaceae bacterium]|nr:hypothetical protein [Pyrinomonadaceae bacterium]
MDYSFYAREAQNVPWPQHELPDLERLPKPVLRQNPIGAGVSLDEVLIVDHPDPISDPIKSTMQLS